MDFEHGARAYEQQRTEAKERLLTLTPKEMDLTERPRSSESNLDGGSNGARFVQLLDDGAGVFKAKNREVYLRQEVKEGTYFLRERAAYLVSKFLEFNIVPPTVIRTLEDQSQSGEVGSLQEFIPDALPAWRAHEPPNEVARFELWLLDYAIWNSDRHEGNVLIKDNAIYAIDNGLSFGQDASRTYEDLFDEAVPDVVIDKVTRFADDDIRTGLLQDLLGELLTESSEIAACIERIKYLAATFEHKNSIQEAELLYDPNDRQSQNFNSYYSMYEAPQEQVTGNF